VDPQTIQDWMQANPYQPFRVVMTDGRTFDITDPRLIMPGRSTLLIGIQDPNEPPGIYGHFISAAMIHIVRIEPVATSPSNP
jgi:hypothetical protein